MTVPRLWIAGAIGCLVLGLGASPAPAAQIGTLVPAASESTSARVTKIVDGDTIRTTKGTIRVIGIDTPEAGRCNAAKATANARRIAPVGSRVRLTLPSGQNNTDRHGRKLRYVSRNGIDLGGAQIKAGLADARFDSRDGYPWHPKQTDYRRWDKRYRDKPCSSGGTGIGGADTYSGCRAYGPNGTSVDDQGRRYTKIDCGTKQPL
jgi:endonuclease YncB( thermonuclease family)